MKLRHDLGDGRDCKFGKARIRVHPHVLRLETGIRIEKAVYLFYEDENGEQVFIANLVPRESEISNGLLRDMKNKLRNYKMEK